MVLIWCYMIQFSLQLVSQRWEKKAIESCKRRARRPYERLKNWYGYSILNNMYSFHCLHNHRLFKLNAMLQILVRLWLDLPDHLLRPYITCCKVCYTLQCRDATCNGLKTRCNLGLQVAMISKNLCNRQLKTVEPSAKTSVAWLNYLCNLCCNGVARQVAGRSHRATCPPYN